MCNKFCAVIRVFFSFVRHGRKKESYLCDMKRGLHTSAFILSACLPYMALDEDEEKKDSLGVMEFLRNQSCKAIKFAIIFSVKKKKAQKILKKAF